jgi:outer membrane immunogenic protein
MHCPRKRKYNRLVTIACRLGIVTAGLIVSAAPGQSQEISARPFAYSPSYSWAGAYIGAQAGHGWGRSHYASTPPWSQEPGVPMDMTGGVVGPYAGYNFQSSGLVAGIEADFAKTWLRSQSVLNPFDDSIVKSEIDWTASVRGRVGYAFGNVMPYIAGGVTFAGVNFPYVLPGSPGITHDNQQTRIGWTAGAGLEYAVFNNLILRGEYRYTDLGEKFEVKRVGAGIHFSDTSVTNHEFRAGVALKFGGPPSSSIDRVLSFSIAPPVNWSGLYAGALAGFNRSQSTYVGLALPAAYVPLKPSGTVPWIYAGYNFQFGRTVLGIEGDVLLSKISGGGALIDGAGRTHPELQVTSKLDNAWSVRGRLGFAFGNFLPYITAGVAGTDYSHTIHFPGEHVFNERFTSWTAGTGLEYAVSDHLILRTEYRHTPYGQATNRHLVSNTVDLSVDEVRAGVAFKFDPAAR